MVVYDIWESYEFCDCVMVDNLEWLMDVMYLGKKFIFWVYNDYLVKSILIIFSFLIGESNGNFGLW